MGKRGPLMGAPQTAMTTTRIDVFLKTLRESGGNWCASARASSPGSKSPRGAASSFYKLAKTNAEFAAAVDNVESGRGLPHHDTLQSHLFPRQNNLFPGPTTVAGFRRHPVD